jgi:hypothetical protein
MNRPKFFVQKHLLYMVCVVYLTTVSSSCYEALNWIVVNNERRSAAARLLRVWVRIPPGGWMSVCCDAMGCQVEVSATTWLLVQRGPTDYGASLCVVKIPREWGGHGPIWDC